MISEGCPKRGKHPNAQARLTKVLGLDVLGGRYVILDRRVDRVKLSPRLGVQEHVKGLGDTLEEGIVIGSRAGPCLLVRVVSEDFTTVGYSNVILGGQVSQVSETEDGIVVLFLNKSGSKISIQSYRTEQDDDRR